MPPYSPLFPYTTLFRSLHRSVVGRAWYAIGFTAAGARYAGIPVARRLGLAYLLSGLVASVAAIVYVAHLGQARRSEEHTSELQSQFHLVCRLLLEKKKN